MRSLLALILVILSTWPALGQEVITAQRRVVAAGGSFVFVNATQQNAGASTINTLSYTCGAAGNFLWINADTLVGSGTVGITVSGNTVVNVSGQVNITTVTGSGDVTATDAYVTSCTGGTVTITATASAGAFGQLLVMEYSKGGFLGVLDNAGTPQLGQSGGSSIACSATSTAAGELNVISVDANNSVGPWGTAPSGFTLRTGSAGSGLNAGVDNTLTTLGTNTFPAYFNSLGNNTITFCAVFK